MKTQPDVSPEIKEFTDLWGQMQKSFFVAQTKLEGHLRERGFNPIKEPYNWKKNPAKLNASEMVLLSHLGVVITTMASVNESQNKLGMAMQTKDWKGSDVFKFIKSMAGILEKIQNLFKGYPAKLPTEDKLYCHTTKIPEA